MNNLDDVAKYVANLYVEHGVDPNKTISRLQKNSSYTPEQIKRIAERSNQLIYHALAAKDRNKLFDFSVADVNKLTEVNSELQKAAEDLVSEARTGYSDPDFRVSDRIEKKANMLKLQQLKDELEGEAITLGMQLEQEIPRIAAQAVDIMLDKKANLFEIYDIVKKECPRASTRLMLAIKEKLQDPIVKTAFLEDPFSVVSSHSPRLQFVNANNSFVARLRWFNTELNRLEDTLNTYNTIAQKLKGE